MTICFSRLWGIYPFLYFFFGGFGDDGGGGRSCNRLGCDNEVTTTRNPLFGSGPSGIPVFLSFGSGTNSSNNTDFSVGEVVPEGEAQTLQCFVLRALAEGLRGEDINGNRLTSIDEIIHGVRNIDRGILGTAVSASFNIGFMGAAFRNGGSLDAKSVDVNKPRGDLFGNFVFGAVGREIGMSRIELNVAAAAFNDATEVRIFGVTVPFSGIRPFSSTLGDDRHDFVLNQLGQSFTNNGCAQ